MATTTTRDGTRIHYQVEGREDGEPLLLAHSLGANLSLWDGQVEAATGLGFRVIRYDHRGHGQSQASPGPYTIQLLGEDVLDLMDALEIEKAAFCGISMGAMAGVWLGMHHPRRFTRMAFCNTAVWTAPREVWDERIAAVEKGGMAAVADAVAERSLGEAFREREPQEMDRLRSMILSADPDGYMACCAAVRDIDLRDRLGLIESPCLVVIGSADVSTPPERGQYLVERIPGAQKEILDTAHLSNIEARDDFNRVVFGFLGGGTVEAREA